MMNTSQIDRLFQLQREEFIFEDIIRAIYEGILKPGDVAVDGGANIGDHTVPLSRCVGKTGVVYAYEPVPATVTTLKRNLTGAGVTNVVVHTKALGAAPARSSFVWVENRATRSALRSPSLPDNPRSQTIEVDVVTLDDEIDSEVRPIRFIKLDLEGGEYDCLRGATCLLKRDRPVVVLENGGESTARNYSYTRESFFELFTNVHYSLLDLFGRPYGPEQWAGKGVPYYTIAVPDASISTLQLGQIAHLASQSALQIVTGAKQSKDRSKSPRLKDR